MNIFYLMLALGCLLQYGQVFKPEFLITGAIFFLCFTIENIHINWKNINKEYYVDAKNIKYAKKYGLVDLYSELKKPDKTDIDEFPIPSYKNPPPPPNRKLFYKKNENEE